MSLYDRTSIEEDETCVLQKLENIVIITDILANRGGVTVSAFEWEQNMNGEHWTKDEVNKKLKKKMEAATESAWETAQKNKTDIRTASFVVALKRITSSIHDRENGKVIIKP